LAVNSLDAGLLKNHIRLSRFGKIVPLRPNIIMRCYLTSIALLALPGLASWAQAPAFEVREAGIAQIRSALAARTITCRALVEKYLMRIEAFDKRGPYLNALVVVNPAALRLADSLDDRQGTGAPLGRLHCIPMIVKDNFETIDLPTTAGSLSMQGFVSNKDAFMVRRLRQEGAIVLAKSNMDEFAFSPQETVNSIMPGHTRNPYDTSRTTAGSSGGTAAAVASSFGAAGLGTDTGNSIRGPSSHQALVGIRSTMGLTSRAGVVPLSYAADIAGPMARTVSDAVAVFQVVAGYDADDPATEPTRGRPLPDYSRSLVAEGLRGARVGVLRQAFERASADPEVLAVFSQALADMRRAGAIIIDTVILTELDSLQRAHRGGCNRFKFDFEKWIASTGSATPVKSLADVVSSGKFHSSVEQRLRSALTATVAPEESAGCAARGRLGPAIATALGEMMDRQQLDALVYPTWSNPPREITDSRAPTGDNSQLFSPITGWPAVQIPMGYTRNNVLPAGMTIFGRAFSEELLIRLAYSYEQATRHRKPPSLAPALR
jgi:Asp-tRNA(Asn)/Glu-tRNA(Gln) amidotransferase A subunit family amidase